MFVMTSFNGKPQASARSRTRSRLRLAVKRLTVRGRLRLAVKRSGVVANAVLFEIKGVNLRRCLRSRLHRVRYSRSSVHRLGQ